MAPVNAVAAKDSEHVDVSGHHHHNSTFGRHHQGQAYAFQDRQQQQQQLTVPRTSSTTFNNNRHHYHIETFPCNNGADYAPRCLHGGKGPRLLDATYGRMICVCLCPKRWQGPECQDLVIHARRR